LDFNTGNATKSNPGMNISNISAKIDTFVAINKKDQREKGCLQRF
jgi:hypothetical protein